VEVKVNTFITNLDGRRVRVVLRTIAGTLLAVGISGAALSLGAEPHSFAESLGIMATLGGPGYLALAVFLARFAERPENARMGAFLIPLGMALGMVNLLGIVAVLTPFLGLYALAMLMMLFIPVLAGGAGLGWGCLLGSAAMTSNRWRQQ
jgi:hypothetical protein